MGFDFRNRQQLGICGNQFLVVGGIEFRSGTDFWQEYCLTDVENNQTFWLSIDKANDEYAIYHAEYERDKFSPNALREAGFHQAGITRASVSDFFGAVDVDRGDTVKSTEYEDASEEQIMSIEQWDDEIEYSSGYYLDWNEIEVGDINNAAVGGASWDDNDGQNTWNNSDSGSWQRNEDGSKKNIVAYIVTAVVALFFFFNIFGSCVFSSCSCNGSDTTASASTTTMSYHLKANPMKYQYETSVTSDLNNQEFAYVYTTDNAIKATAEDLVSAVALAKPEIQESEDGETVTIMTPNEYAVVYKGKEGNTKTHIQVSPRSYAYESSNGLHNGSENANNHYRGFYYIRGYNSDRSRYSSRRHGYNNYKTRVVYNPNNRYQTYATQKHQNAVRSMRQKSSSTRSYSSSRRMGK